MVSNGFVEAILARFFKIYSFNISDVFESVLKVKLYINLLLGTFVCWVIVNAVQKQLCAFLTFFGLELFTRKLRLNPIPRRKPSEFHSRCIFDNKNKTGKNKKNCVFKNK